MNLRRVLKELLVQQISFSDGKVFLLFHPESPVKVDKLLELIHKQKNRFRLAPDGRLSFTPKHHEWQPLAAEVVELLQTIREIPAPKGAEPTQYWGEGLLENWSDGKTSSRILQHSSTPIMILHDYRLNRADAQPINSTLLPWVVIGVTFLTVAMAFGAIIGAIALSLAPVPALVLGWAAQAAIPGNPQKGSLTAGV